MQAPSATPETETTRLVSTSNRSDEASEPGSEGSIEAEPSGEPSIGDRSGGEGGIEDGPNGTGSIATSSSALKRKARGMPTIDLSDDSDSDFDDNYDSRKRARLSSPNSPGGAVDNATTAPPVKAGSKDRQPIPSEDVPTAGTPTPEAVLETASDEHVDNASTATDAMRGLSIKSETETKHVVTTSNQSDEANEPSGEPSIEDESDDESGSEDRSDTPAHTPATSIVLISSDDESDDESDGTDSSDMDVDKAATATAAIQAPSSEAEIKPEVSSSNHSEEASEPGSEGGIEDKSGGKPSGEDGPNGTGSIATSSAALKRKARGMPTSDLSDDSDDSDSDSDSDDYYDTGKRTRLSSQNQPGGDRTAEWVPGHELQFEEFQVMLKTNFQEILRKRKAELEAEPEAEPEAELEADPEAVMEAALDALLEAERADELDASSDSD
ncbi:hypothetical protein GGI21_004167 [Coemansia aciculifera]|nr:hypothetical protein GGI21_004167 [Coemansia aciculifera]